MRTIAYIDGFNLYFGCLKGTPYKWLDLVALCKRLATEKNPASELVQVKFFTADVKAKLSQHGLLSPQAQQSYHRALTALYTPPQLEIIKGFYSLERAFFHPHKTPVPLDKRVAVWRPEEKQTDVNIALHMYRDAMQDNCDTMLLLSNDSDLAPVLDAVKECRPSIELGLIFPRAEGTKRPPNGMLSSRTDWKRDHIRNDELEAAQMPKLVPTHKKPAIKPDYW